MVPSSVRLDAAFAWLARAAAVLVIALMLALVALLVLGAWPAIGQYGAGFAWRNVWDPVRGDFGGFALLCGTLVTAALALLMALPPSFGMAVFLSELCPRWLRTPLGVLVELLAAIPSIVYGMWGLMVLGPLLARHVQEPLQQTLMDWPQLARWVQGAPVGIGMFPAAVVLAIMMLPFMAAVMRDVLLLVPATLKEAAHGLGATTREVLWQVVLPRARGGLLGAAMLGLGRALGETMAVTFVIGNMNQMASPSLFEAAGSITSALANEFAEAGGNMHRAALMYLALLLCAISFFSLLLARLLTRGRTPHPGA